LFMKWLKLFYLRGITNQENKRVLFLNCKFLLCFMINLFLKCFLWLRIVFFVLLRWAPKGLRRSGWTSVVQKVKQPIKDVTNQWLWELHKINKIYCLIDFQCGRRVFVKFSCWNVVTILNSGLKRWREREISSSHIIKWQRVWQILEHSFDKILQEETSDNG
jgi:hypothetical protein